MNALETPLCGECLGQGITFLFPWVESAIAGGPAFLHNIVNGWFVVPCPYCQFERYWLRPREIL